MLLIELILDGFAKLSVKNLRLSFSSTFYSVLSYVVHRRARPCLSLLDAVISLSPFPRNPKYLNRHAAQHMGPYPSVNDSSSVARIPVMASATSRSARRSARVRSSASLE